MKLGQERSNLLFARVQGSPRAGPLTEVQHDRGEPGPPLPRRAAQLERDDLVGVELGPPPHETAPAQGHSPAVESMA